MDAIEVAGSESIEVIAQFDGAIVDVAHIVRDDGAEAAARRTRWLYGAGLGALGVAAVAFFCAIAGVALGRTVDAIVAVCLAGGTWAILRALDRGGWRGSFAPPRAYTIGPDPRASFAVEAAAVPVPCHPLVRIDELGEFVLDVPASSGVPRSQKLAAGARATVQVGGATFHVANVPAPRRQAMPQGIDWTREVYLGGVTLVVSAFLFLVYSIPPSPQSLALDLIHGEHFARFVIVPPQEPPPPPLPGPANDSAAAGHAAREKAGTLGKTTAKERTGVLKLPGPMSREKVMAAAQTAAQTAGILGMMRSLDGTHSASIFGRDTALGDNASEILVGLQGTQLNDGYGTGFDELGHGPGGGGDSDKTIGAGPLGSIGFCRGTACRDGAKAYARSAPTGDLVHRAKAPDVVPGQVTLHCGAGNEGCLDKEIIRRVIRQHRNEVRFCYERGLITKPELQGRVVTSFTISNGGRVLSSAVTDTSLRTPDVEACIAEAVRRWEFPSSAQTSMVSYPFILTPPR